jgi:hypothetical protein
VTCCVLILKQYVNQLDFFDTFSFLFFQIGKWSSELLRKVEELNSLRELSNEASVMASGVPMAETTFLWAPSKARYICARAFKRGLRPGNRSSYCHSWDYFLVGSVNRLAPELWYGSLPSAPCAVGCAAGCAAGGAAGCVIWLCSLVVQSGCAAWLCSLAVQSGCAVWLCSWSGCAAGCTAGCYSWVLSWLGSRGVGASWVSKVF